MAPSNKLAVVHSKQGIGRGKELRVEDNLQGVGSESEGWGVRVRVWGVRVRGWDVWGESCLDSVVWCGKNEHSKSSCKKLLLLQVVSMNHLSLCSSPTLSAPAPPTRCDTYAVL